MRSNGRCGWRNVAPAAVCGMVVVISLTLFIRYLLGQPSVRFEIVALASGVTLPTAVQWGLPKFAILHARGFEAEFLDVESLLVRGPGREVTIQIPHQRVRLEANLSRGNEGPSFQATVDGNMGEGSDVSLPSGSRLDAAGFDPRLGPTVVISVPPLSEAQVLLRASKLRFLEVNRMRLATAEAPDWIQSEESVAIDPVSSGLRLITAKILPIKTRDGASRKLRISFVRGDGGGRLFHAVDRQDNGLHVSGVITLARSRNPVIRVNERPISWQPTGIAYDTKIDLIEGKISSLDVVRSPEGGAWLLDVRFNGLARSIVVGNTELVPTRLQAWIYGSLLQATAAGLAGLLAISILAVIIKVTAKKVIDLAFTGIPEDFAMNDRRSYNVNVSGDNVVINIGDVVRDVVNTVGGDISKSEAGAQVKELLEALVGAMSSMAPAVDPRLAQQLANDVKALSSELTQKVPRKKWYELSLEGIKEAAAAAGEIGKPMMEIAMRLAELLSESGG